MTQNTLIVAALALLVGVAGGYAVWGTDAPKYQGSHMMPDGSMMGQNIDEHFIAQMIPHHEGAIQMAEVALERSKRPEILSLANGIIEAQEGEITKMHGWYQQWFGSVPPAQGHGMHMDGMSGDLDRLKNTAAADFDKEFIDQMIPHHEMAVMMAQMLESSTSRPEMRTLADQIITSQSREIQMMRSWRQTWYGE